MNVHIDSFRPSSPEPEQLAPARISVAFGDGIGPEIMQASLQVLMAAGARLEIEPVDMGERVYLAGHSAGLLPMHGTACGARGCSTRRRSRRRRAVDSRAST